MGEQHCSTEPNGSIAQQHAHFVLVTVHTIILALAEYVA